MSVAFTHAFVEGMRYNGVYVDFEPGWEHRGNGQTFPGGQPEGPLTHHTGVDYGAGYRTLVDGRADLAGPLSNICTWPTAPAGYVGHITVIAAFPANHAGAAGGSWARPYPDTRVFNRLVWGNEVMFPGFKPWTASQYRTARIAAAVVLGIRRRGAEWAKGHYETSVTGKWDPGIGNGRAEWFPMDRFRREIGDALKEDDMATPEELWDHYLLDRWSGNEMRAGQLLGWIGQHVVAARRDSAENNKILAGQQAAINALAAALAEREGIDPAVITEAVKTAMTTSISETVLPELRTVVTDVLGADNEAQADAIVDELATRLHGQAQT